MKEFFPNGNGDKFFDHFFDVIDLDHSGSINFVEYMMFVSLIWQADIKEKLEWVFNLLDSNHDGKIEKEKMMEMIQSGIDFISEEFYGQFKDGKDPKEIVDKIFNKLDTNKDNFLDKTEFVEGIIAETKKSSNEDKQETETPKNDTEMPEKDTETAKKDLETPKKESETPKNDNDMPKKDTETAKKDPETLKKVIETPKKNE